MAEDRVTRAAEAMQEGWRKGVEAAQDQFVQNLAAAQEQTRRATAAMGEQYRQNVAAMQGQAQAAMNLAQESIRQNTAAMQNEWGRAGEGLRPWMTEPFAAVQGAQEAMIEGTERLTRQGAQTATAAFDAAWETWMALFGTLAWSQEQTEATLRRLIDQGRVNREDGNRMLRELGEQARRNSQELSRMVQEGVRSGLQAMRAQDSFAAQTPATPAGSAVAAEQFEALSRKIDELNAKIEALNTAAKPAIVKATK
jgi:polyhydroxyalkanoate synthesis regulator phasin